MANGILQQNGISKTSFSDTVIDLLDNESTKYRNVMLIVQQTVERLLILSRYLTFIGLK